MINGHTLNNLLVFSLFASLIQCSAVKEVLFEKVNTAPTISNKTITQTAATKNSLSLSWAAASDDTTSAENIEYGVYYSTTALTSIDLIKTNGTLVTNYQSNLTSLTISSLSNSTLYYINIVARDTEGSESIYTSTAFSTLAAGTLDTTFNSSGYLTYDNASGGASGVDHMWEVALVNNSYVTVGESYDTTSGNIQELTAYGITTSGALNTSFNSSGSTPGIYTINVVGSDVFRGLVTDNDNNVYAAGYTNELGDIDIAIVKFNANGSLDTSWGTAGKLVINNVNGGVDETEYIIAAAHRNGPTWWWP